MKVFIPSRGRSDSVTSLNFLPLSDKRIQVYLVVATEKEKKRYVRNNPQIPESNILVSGATNVTRQRQWIMDQVKRDEWFMMLDDNLYALTRFSDKYYKREELSHKLIARIGNKDRKHGPFMVPINPEELPDLLSEAIDKAEQVGARLVGFSVMDNPFFRNKHWLQSGYISNKMILVKRGDVMWDCNLEMMEEAGFCAENYVRYGKVLINKFILPQKIHYAPGGIGVYDKRFPRKTQECKYLARKYKGLISLRNPPGKPKNSEVRFTLRTVGSIERWRVQNGFSSPKKI